MFCQLELLRRCFPPSVRHILEELPESLDETYERILREIRKPNQGHAHRLLQCLAVAVRPLRIEELAEFLAFDFNAEGMPKLNPDWRWEDQEEAVTSVCSSLVIIVKDGDSRLVQFSHFSVKEFLTAHRLVEPMRDISRFHIRLDAAHTILAQACLGVLLQLDDRVDRDSIKNFPLARYAAQYWPTHAREENVLPHVMDGVELLFDEDEPHFAVWLWIYNEDWGGLSMSTMRPVEPEAAPLYYAALLGLRDLSEHLIFEHPEHLHSRGGIYETPVHAAVNAENASVLSLLIGYGADVEGQYGSINGGTLLNTAAQYGNLEVGQRLLHHGANINAQDSEGNTPLIDAVSQGNVEFTQMLLERGADADASNDDGNSAFQFVARDEDPEIVELLSKYRTKSESDIQTDRDSMLSSAGSIPSLVSNHSEEE